MSVHDHQPPRWADKFLQWFCDAELLEDLQGDLHERFSIRLRSSSPFVAKAMFVWDVLTFLRPYTWKRESHAASFLFMWQYYFTNAARNLKRNPLHTCLNLLGIVISLSAFALVFLFVSDELKYDRHYDKAHRIWRITTEIISPGTNNHVAATNGPLGQRLQEQYPQVESFVSLSRLKGKIVLESDRKNFQEDRLYRADRSYFEIFSHDWLAGIPEKALDKPNKIVITKTLAAKYFGTESALEKTLYIRDEAFNVSGVIADLPDQTDLKFDALISPNLEFLTDDHDWTITYLLFKEGIDALDFKPKLDSASQQFLQSEIGAADAKMFYRMEALPDVHFGSPKLFDTPKSSRTNVIIFSVVGVLILVMACINYVNMAMMRVVKMRTQAGIRKVMGALSKQLFGQSVVEALIICIAGAVLACIVTMLFADVLGRITGRDFSIGPLITPTSVALAIAGIILLALAAGGYPALILSSTQPAKVLSGQEKISSKNRIRKTLVVVQFAVSICLLTCGKIVYDQWQVLTGTNPGFSKEQVLVIDVPAERESLDAVQEVRNDLIQLPFVTHVSSAGYNSLPTSPMDIDAYDVMRNGENIAMIFNNITVDQEYIPLLDIEVVEGRNFNPSDIENEWNTILVNESLVRSLGWEHPLGEIVYFGSSAYEVVGVVADFHFNSLHRKIEPIVFHGSLDGTEKLLIKLKATGFDNINTIENVWTKHTGRAMESEFLDTYYHHQYLNEKNTQTVLQYFSAFTLIIACMGLFGLVAASTTSRVKEFAIRKTLGARAHEIVVLIIREYVKLFIAGIFIAVPIAWLSMINWLSIFPYKTSLDSTDFIWPVLLTLTSILAAVMFHVVRAARIEPAASIRHN
jgi:putative ABC transport system permease protein